MEDVTALTLMLKDRDATVREQAARSLSTLGARARDAVPALTAALGDQVPSVRAWAGWALFHIGADQRAIPALIEGLKDADRDVRFSSVRALVTITLSPAQALPALMEALREEDEGAIIDSVRWALQVIGPDSVAPLVEALRGGDTRLRFRAAAALSSREVGRARQAIPPLLDALADADAHVRLFAAQSLGDIGRACQDQIADFGDVWTQVPRSLGRCLTDMDVRVRERAAWALMWLGREASPAADDLQAAMQDADERTRRWITKALDQINQRHAED